MLKSWGTAKVDWRGPAPLWIALAWLLSVFWPPLPVTLFFWPSNNTGLETIRDPRAVALVIGAVAVTLIYRFIERERRRRRTPNSRFGVIVRFVAFGFIATVLAAAAGAVAMAVIAMFSPGDALRRVDVAKETLVTGIAIMPIAVLLGVSYSVWAGLMTSLIAFGAPRPSARPRHIMMDELSSEGPAPAMAAMSVAPAAAPIATFAAEPEPQPPAVGPHPETDMEAAMRPDWD